MAGRALGWAAVGARRLRSDAAVAAGAGAAAGAVRAPGAYTRAPDAASHIRPLHIEPNPQETNEAREWRELQETVAQKAHVFWKENNERFLKGKAAYEAAIVARGERVTAENLSDYYRQFQTENEERHRQFNREWWSDNVRMLWPALRAHLRRP